MKKLKLLLLSLLLIIPFNMVKAEEGVLEPVKVYVFYAPGCHWCEEQFNYLEALDSYNEKFVVVRKELFQSDLRTPGADYDLGQDVGTAFTQAGFTNARPEGTPYVVVSDLYAASAYNDSLETVINQAYEAGDKDVVGCIEAGNDNCIEGAVSTKKELSPKMFIILGISVVIIVPLLIFVNSYINKNVVVADEEVKAEKKKTSAKKTTTKKKEK